MAGKIIVIPLTYTQAAVQQVGQTDTNLPSKIIPTTVDVLQTFFN